MQITTFAIVIKKKDYKDSDKIVSFITEDLGKISAIGKFAKKSIKRNLNLLDFGYLLKVKLRYYSAKELFFIEKITVVENFLPEYNYNKFLITSFVNELLFYVVYGAEESSGLFRLTLEFFRDLSVTDKNRFGLIFSVLTRYKIKLLETLGYKIILDKCIVCGEEKTLYYYSLDKIGFICNRCKKDTSGVNVYQGTKKVLANLEKNIKISMPITSQLDEIFSANMEKIVSINGFNKINRLYAVIKNGI